MMAAAEIEPTMVPTIPPVVSTPPSGLPEALMGEGGGRKVGMGAGVGGDGADGFDAAGQGGK